MSTWVPEFRLYDSAGTGLLYTFPAVNYTNAPQSIERFVEHENVRAKGSLIINGGEASWDLEMRFTIIGDDYEDITSKIVTLENTVQFNTPYILIIAKTPTTSFQYNVKRLEAFDYADSLRTSFQKVSCILRVNSW